VARRLRASCCKHDLLVLDDASKSQDALAGSGTMGFRGFSTACAVNGLQVHLATRILLTSGIDQVGGSIS
jgi:hypothetical protein